MPVQYDRSKNWKGSTYIEAGVFCSLHNFVLCPFTAVCPLGRNTKPMGHFKGSWVPIADAANDWVNVEKINSCRKWSDESSDDPQWDNENESDYAMTEDLLCCADVSGNT